MIVLVVGDFLDADDVLLLIGDDAGDGSGLAGGADVIVELAVGVLVEEVDDVFLGFGILDDDDGFALGRFAEVALVAGDLAGENGFFLLGLLVLGLVGVAGE